MCITTVDADNDPKPLINSSVRLGGPTVLTSYPSLHGPKRTYTWHEQVLVKVVHAMVQNDKYYYSHTLDFKRSIYISKFTSLAIIIIIFFKKYNKLYVK